MKLYIPYFHIISVPTPMYEKGSYDVVVKVGSGLPFELYINDVLAGSGIGTGSDQDVSVLITNAMISLSPVEVRLEGLRTKTTNITAWGPSLITSILSQHDDQGSYQDGVGWAPTISANTLTSTAYPTTGTKNGRRTTIYDGSTQFLRASFTRNQPTETWVAGQWIGAVVSGSKTMVSGFASAGQLYRTSTLMGIYAGVVYNLAPASDLTDRWLVAGGVFTGPNSQIYDNVSLLGTGSTGTSAPAGLTIGQSGSGTNWANCEVGEVITTNGLTSAEEKTHIVGYLSKVWGIV